MDINIKRTGIGLVLLLILTNVWKWWPSVDARLRAQDTSQMFSVEDFQVHGLTREMQPKSERDLFHKGRGRPSNNEGTGGVGERSASTALPRQFANGATAPFSPQVSAAKAGLLQIEQIKCIGVLFQENRKPEAYLVRGDQHYIMRLGDVLEGRFEVEKIMIDAVYFKDRQTGVTGAVPVDGKEGSTSK